MGSTFLFFNSLTMNGLIGLIAVSIVALVLILMVIPNIKPIAKAVPILKSVWNASDGQESSEKNEKTMIEIITSMQKELAMSNKIATNHTHELPEMKKQLDRIEEKQSSQSERLARVETAIKFIQK